MQVRIQDFKLGGVHLKKLCRAKGGAKFFGYFVWKIMILRQKIIFFPILGGARTGCAPPPGSAPVMCWVEWHVRMWPTVNTIKIQYNVLLYSTKWTSISYHSKVPCSPNDIAAKSFTWILVKTIPNEVTSRVIVLDVIVFFETINVLYVR
jgi:hypothetical protein